MSLNTVNTTKEFVQTIKYEYKYIHKLTLTYELKIILQYCRILFNYPQM